MAALKEHWGPRFISRKITDWMGHPESPVVCPGLRFFTFKLRSVGKRLF